jgi:hypothetical protein
MGWSPYIDMSEAIERSPWLLSSAGRYLPAVDDTLGVVGIASKKPPPCHFEMSEAIEKSPNAANCLMRYLPAVDMTNWGGWDCK